MSDVEPTKLAKPKSAKEIKLDATLKSMSDDVVLPGRVAKAEPVADEVAEPAKTTRAGRLPPDSAKPSQAVSEE